MFGACLAPAARSAWRQDSARRIGAWLTDAPSPTIPDNPTPEKFAGSRAAVPRRLRNKILPPVGQLAARTPTPVVRPRPAWPGGVRRQGAQLAEHCSRRSPCCGGGGSHRGTPATQHHASIRVPNAHAPPRALPNRRGAQHLLPHENSTGHHPPSKHPDQARGGGARPRSRWPTYSRCSRGGSRRRSLKPGRRPRQPATNARAPAAAPTACQPPPTNPTTDHDRTVTLGSQARAVTQPHYVQQGSLIPARRLRLSPNTTSTRRC